MFCADFETTVYSGQDHTEGWAAALVEMGTEDVKIFHSIDKIKGMNIVFTTTAKTDEEAAALLQFLGMPFEK